MANITLLNFDDPIEDSNQVLNGNFTALNAELATRAAAGHGHAIAEVTGLQAVLDGKAASAHSHAIADTAGLQAALDGKSAVGHHHDAAYAPLAHSHAIANVTGLQAALDGKAASAHSHAIADTAGLQSALDGKSAVGHHHDAAYAPLAHSHAIANVTGLQAALDGKAASAHSHAIADTTGLQTALDGKAASAHGHAIADTTGLQTALDAKEPLLPGKSGQAHKVLRVNATADAWELASVAAGAAAEQAVIAYNAGLAAGANLFFGLGFTGAGATTENQRQWVATRALTVSRLYVLMRTANPATANLTFTLRVNGVDTALVLTIPESAPAGVYSQTGQEVSVQEGDLLTWRIANTGTSSSGTPTTFSWRQA